MKSFELLESNIDISKLLSQLEENPELWENITKRQTVEGSPHKYTKSIFLRWAKDLSVHSAFNDLRPCTYPEAEILFEAFNLVDHVYGKVDGRELGRVLVVCLEPGGVITPHSDEGAYADKFERFHVSLKSEEGNIFNCDGETVHMKPGELWYFNHKGYHSLENKSDKPRIHLIIDCVAPKFRKERQ